MNKLPQVVAQGLLCSLVIITK